ncbi:MAG: esterase [Gammaproteobacteria bacterium]|jgi:esterase
MKESPILHYRQEGDGFPLIILHGLFGSSRNWQSIAKQYAGTFQVISVDARCHGQSFHNADMNYDCMSDDVIRLMDSLGLEKCHLLGHSMGGKTAMAVSVKENERISKLLLVDIAPIVYRHSHDHLIDPILALDLDGISNRADADRILSEKVIDAQLRSFLLHNLVRNDGQWQWQVNWSSIKFNMNKLLGEPVDGDKWQVRSPTLVISGAKSDYVNSDAEVAFKKHFLQLQYQKIDGAGHWLHAEKPELFLHYTLAFLNNTAS